MIFTVLGAVAELERSLIVERVKAGIRNARAKGKKLGRPLSLALGLFGNFCSLEVLHLLPQLRINLVRDGHNVRKQCTELQILHVVVQRRKNADLQQSRLLYQHLYWVALFMPQFPMVGRSL